MNRARVIRLLRELLLELEGGADDGARTAAAVRQERYRKLKKEREERDEIRNASRSGDVTKRNEPHNEKRHALRNEKVPAPFPLSDSPLIPTLQNTHTPRTGERGLSEEASEKAASPETQEILGELRKHTVLADVATLKMAEGLESNRMMRGTPVTQIVTAICDVVRDVTLRDANRDAVTSREMASMLGRYADKASVRPRSSKHEVQKMTEAAPAWMAEARKAGFT